MRPTRLIMQAFGPYAGRQELAMDDLGETGLYAITGETGAGKTTIFDAIVYALYGEGSGEDRSDGRNFRSVGADPGLETLVELEFVSGGKVYRVWRRPEQTIAGKRKDALVTKAASQTLTMPDGTKYTRSREIDERIEKDILGVTKDQFCQIVMIAQGEFRKLLRADTRERTKILRRIFKTERFDALTRQMDRLCKDKYRELRTSREQTCFSLRALQAEAGTALSASLEAMKPTGADALILEEAMALADAIAGADDADREAAQGLLKRAAEARESARSARDRAMEQRKKQGELETLRGEAERAREHLEAARRALEAAKGREPDIERLGREATVGEMALPKYEALEALDRERVGLRGSMAAQEKAAGEAEAQKTALEGRRAALRQEAEGLEDAPERLVEAARGLSDAKSAGKRLSDLNARADALEEAQSRLKAAEDSLAKARESEEKAGEGLAELVREAEALGNTELACSRLEAGQRDRIAEAKALDDLAELLEEHRAALKKLRAAQDSCKKKEEAAKELRDEAGALRRRYNANIAGIWAASLTDGTPCPVCGSIHHPDRARLTEDAVTEQAARDAEESADSAERAYNEQARTCAAQLEICDGLKRRISERLPEVPEPEWEAEAGRRRKDNARAREALADGLKSARRADERRRQLEDTEIKRARDGASRAAEARQAAEAEIAAAKTDLKTAEREAADAAKGVMPEAWTRLELSDKMAENDRETKRWKALEDRAERDRERLEAIGTEAEGIERELREATEKLVAAREAISDLTARLEGCDRQLADLKVGLPYPTRGECERSIERKARDKRALEKAIEDATGSVRDRENDIAGRAGRIRALEDELEGLPPADLPALERKYDEADKAWKAALEREKAIHARRENNARQIEGLKRSAEAAKTLEREYRVMKDVSDTASGDVSGQEKLSLETYVQTAYFDRIIGYANRRLVHMSRQQYDLARQSREDGDKRAKTGLELDVVDHANATRRAVSTLSGGEGFLASLSLALGMSDAIQASATSAVQLDTMFVDEGFGSLSERFLGLVMDELYDTANSGHRLIGVISHVDDVKEGIERRIEVSKSDDGVSVAEII